VLWADARGLDGEAIATSLLAVAEELEILAPAAGVATTPIGAEVAARGGRSRVTIVPSGGDRDFLAPLEIGVLHPLPPPSLYPLLAGVGIERCADLARLDRESVEVRFGSDGLALWRLARADDARALFTPRPRELPGAEVEWVDYELDQQEHLLFIVNSLLGTVVEQLGGDRLGAHSLLLSFTLADRSVVAETIGASHPTADRRVWLRVIRSRLDQLTFPAPVVKIRLEVARAAPITDRQGDLFDLGFATARATETALAHLLDLQPDAIAVAERCRHPLPERRLAWIVDPAGETATGGGGAAVGGAAPVTDPELTIQLLIEPRPIEVWVTTRRDARIPDRYFDGTRTYSLRIAMGPDLVSGGFGEARFSREYFQAVRDDGVMVLLGHDLEANGWTLAGWWD
jgi:protein ImuB